MKFSEIDKIEKGAKDTKGYRLHHKITQEQYNLIQRELDKK
jgi:hypothetical protein